MKKIFFVLSFVLLFGLPAGAVDESCLSADKLSIDDDGIAYTEKGIPYTGCMYLNYPNGNLHYQGTLKNGQLDGVYKQYYPNGQLEHESPMINGLEQGVSKLYWEDGTLKGENTYINGKLNGPFKKYHKNGRLHVEGTYKDDMLDGQNTVYFDDGRVKYSNRYRMDKKIYRTRDVTLAQEVSIGGKYIPEKGKNLPVSVTSENKTVNAIVVDSVSEGYEYLRQEYPNHKFLQQALIKSGDVYMDVLTIETADGENKEIYFDINSFYGTFGKTASGKENNYEIK